LEANLKDIKWKGFLQSIPRKQLALTMFYGIARIVISAAWPYTLYHYFDKNTNITLDKILLLSAFVIAMFVLSSFASLKQSLTNIDIMRKFSQSLFERMWEKIHSLEWLTFHGKNRVYFFDILLVDGWRLRHGMMALLESVIVNAIIGASLTFFIAFISWPLFVLFIGGLGFTSLLQFYSTRRVRPNMKHFHNAWRDQHLSFAKSIDQFDLLKMGRGYEETKRTNSENADTFLASNTTMVYSQSKWRAINQAANNLVKVVVFITGFYWVQIKFVELTDLLLVLLVVSAIQNYLVGLPAAITQFIEGQEAAKSIDAFFALPSENTSLVNTVEDIAPVEQISIENLHFSYPGKPEVVNGNIHLEKGKIYLWTGSNGSGKSTTARLVLGLIDPTGGILRINGKETDWQTLKQLRQRFAYINQDAAMFMGTIQENILFGHPEPQQAWNIVDNSWLTNLLPRGKNSHLRKIGDRGEGISGGEARRLALIREWLRKSDLIILDEPLNHLDDYAINEIKREIETLKNSAIIVIISHQPGFEKIADEIRHF
jgi:ABC-type multidrug transport system fused ATPase/permease subunit